MTLNGRNVTLAEITKISGGLIRSESKSAQSLVAVSVNKIRVNSLYIYGSIYNGTSRGHLCDSKAFLYELGRIQVLG